VLSTLDPRTRADLTQIFRGLNRSVAGRGPQIAAILRNGQAGMGNAAQLLGQLDGDGTALRLLDSSSARVVATLAQTPGSLSGTADELAQMLGTLAGRQQALSAGLAQLPAGLQAARGALDHLRASVGTLVGLVQAAAPGTARLPRFATQLEPVMDSAVPALHDLRALIVDGPAQLRAIDALLHTVRGASAPLTAMLTTLTPIANQLRARFPDVFAFLANWADFTSDYDAVGHGGRVGLVESPTPTNAIGPADNRGGELAPPFIRDPGVLGGAPWLDYQKSFVGARK
jgi:ABC-type transporter Mla subunit MlaD